MTAQGQTALVSLDRAQGDLQGQLYRALRARILGGTLRAGTRLPSTRALAVSLGLSRATIVGAYERLKAEGYLDSAAGKAARIADIEPPAASAPLRPQAAVTPTSSPLPAALSPGVPDLAAFPSALWGRLLATRAKRLNVAELGYGAPVGLPALAEAILAHIAVTRGVVAAPEQLVLFPSTRAAIALLARVALRGQPSGAAPVWVEDPAYPSAREILRQAGGRIVPVPVDAAGIVMDHAATLPAPRLIYVTPSHQYPTGATMSLARRLSLLAHARQTGALILEDDYDSEFQFDGRPIAALQGIDQAGTVIYLGTLAKVLAPGVRLAYAILPRGLLAEARAVMQLEGMAVSVHIQAAFLAFLREGHFGAHIRRMTPLYAARMAAFRAAVRQHCGAWLEPGPGTGGLQLALWFRDETLDDVPVAERLRQRGYAPQPLSTMYLGTGRPGLLCGIAGLKPEQSQRVAAEIAEILRR